MILAAWRGTSLAMRRGMRCFDYLGCLLSPCALALPFWLGFVACIDAPLPDTPPASRLVTAWDPRDCGSPHRVVVELEDDGGRMLSAGTACSVGSVTLDAPHWGIYYGRIYAWEQVDNKPEIRSVMPIRIAVDEPVVRWWVATPH